MLLVLLKPEPQPVILLGQDPWVLVWVVTESWFLVPPKSEPQPLVLLVQDTRVLVDGVRVTELWVLVLLKPELKPVVLQDTWYWS